MTHNSFSSFFQFIELPTKGFSFGFRPRNQCGFCFQTLLKSVACFFISVQAILDPSQHLPCCLISRKIHPFPDKAPDQVEFIFPLGKNSPAIFSNKIFFITTGFQVFDLDLIGHFRYFNVLVKGVDKVKPRTPHNDSEKRYCGESQHDFPAGFHLSKHGFSFSRFLNGNIYRVFQYTNLNTKTALPTDFLENKPNRFSRKTCNFRIPYRF